MDFRQTYRQTFARLGVELQDVDGCAEQELSAAEARLGIHVRPALRQYFELMGHEQQLNQAHNHLLPPDQWFIDEGKLAFMAENQNVVFWGVPVDIPADDPPVLQGVNGEAIEWYAEHDQCSVFLCVMLHWQAVMGGPGRTWSALVDESMPEKLKGWDYAGTVNELRAYSRDGVALCFVPWSDGPRVFVAGPEPRVDAAAAELSIEWDPSYE